MIFKTYNEANKYTPVTDENFSYAQTQKVFTEYKSKIKKANKGTGTGTWLHNKEMISPSDKTVMRTNYDTFYSWILLDMNSDAILVIPKNDRYVSAMTVDLEHYNPFVFDEPGEYKLTKQNTKTDTLLIIVRVQVNVEDKNDIKKAHKIQDGFEIIQKDKGDYRPKDKFKPEELTEYLAKFSAMQEKYDSDEMFGKKGEIELEPHNVGVATGWGGLNKDQAIYLIENPTSTNNQELILKDVPVDAFWSVTVYDKEGFTVSKIYNKNSQSVIKNHNQTTTISFGLKTFGMNYMDIFEGWNYTIRLYKPNKDFDKWEQPKLNKVNL